MRFLKNNNGFGVAEIIFFLMILAIGFGSIELFGKWVKWEGEKQKIERSHKAEVLVLQTEKELLQTIGELPLLSSEISDWIGPLVKAWKELEELCIYGEDQHKLMSPVYKSAIIALEKRHYKILKKHPKIKWRCKDIAYLYSLTWNDEKEAEWLAIAEK